MTEYRPSCSGTTIARTRTRTSTVNGGATVAGVSTCVSGLRAGSIDLTREDALTANLPITARGYSGGREYDLRELWAGRRGDHIDFAFGRLLIRESDALRIDGARLWWRFSESWQATVFGGLYPNPFARTLTDDYLSKNALAGAAGANIAYNYPRIWGSASLVSTLFGAPDDGGPIPPTGDPKNPRLG